MSAVFTIRIPISTQSELRAMQSFQEEVILGVNFETTRVVWE